MWTEGSRADTLRNIPALEELGGKEEGLRKQAGSRRRRRRRKARKEWKTERSLWVVKSVIHRRKIKSKMETGQLRGCSKRGQRGKAQCRWLLPG